MLVSLAWLGPALLGFVTSLGEAHIFGMPLDLRAAFFYGSDWLLYAVLTPGVFFFARRWPITRPHLVSRTVLHIALSVIFSALWAGGGTVLKLLLQPNSFQHGVAQYAAGWFVGTLPFGCALYLGMVGVEHAIRYFTEARAREVQMMRLSEQLTTARLSSLKAQLNPHFLFNALNTIAVLMREGDSAGATRVIEQLSDVLRLTLSRNSENEVTLEDELELVREYLEVEGARFSDRLRPTFDVDADTLFAAVPSFALQHLVENAIRHGIARRSDAGRIVISARREGDLLEVTVTDDGPGIGKGITELDGHGLANTRERLRTLYGDRASLEVTAAPGGGTIARLRVPFHELPVVRTENVSA
jgi:two-component system LytT family sensor kinase